MEVDAEYLQVEIRCRRLRGSGADDPPRARKIDSPQVGSCSQEVGDRWRVRKALPAFTWVGQRDYAADEPDHGEQGREPAEAQERREMSRTIEFMASGGRWREAEADRVDDRLAMLRRASARA